MVLSPHRLSAVSPRCSQNSTNVGPVKHTSFPTMNQPPPFSTPFPSSSSRSSDGNSSLLNEGGSASQVPQASVVLAVYESVVWPDSLSKWLVDGAGL